MNLKHSILINPKLLLLLNLKNRIFSFFPLFFNSIKKTTFIKPSTAQTSYFPVEKTKIIFILLKTENIELPFTDILRTRSLLTMKRVFSFMEKLSKLLKIPGHYYYEKIHEHGNNSSWKIRFYGKSSYHVETSSLSFFFVNKTSIHSVVYKYHLHLTETLNVHYQDMIQAKPIPLNWLERIFNKIIFSTVLFVLYNPVFNFNVTICNFIWNVILC